MWELAYQVRMSFQEAQAQAESLLINAAGVTHPLGTLLGRGVVSKAAIRALCPPDGRK